MLQQGDTLRHTVRASLGAAFLGLIALAGSHNSTIAGGLYVNEFASLSMGVAGAGAEAVANDASTSFALHNPAGMTRLEGHQVSAGAGLFIGKTKFDADATTPFGGGNGGNQAGIAPVLGTRGVYSATEDLKLGMSLFSISGAALDPNNAWTGRYELRDINLLTLTANPSVAYRVNDWLSLAGGALVTYGKIDYKLAAPLGGAGQVKIDGDDFAFGFNFGAMVELSPQTRFGLIYVSKTDLDFGGDLTAATGGGPSFSTSSNLEFTFPQLVRVGAYHELNDQWALLGTVGWEDWSDFDSLLVSTAAGAADIPTGWEDTYHFSGGVHYRPADDWLLQAGITYDTSPVSSTNRLAALPIDRQFRYAVGAQYEWSERLTVGGAFEFIDLGDARINNPAVLQGEYDENRLFMLGLTFNYKF